MVIAFDVHFKSFKFVLVHLDALKSQSLVPHCRVDLILLLRLLNLTSAPNDDKRIRSTGSILALDISGLDDGDADQVFLPL